MAERTDTYRTDPVQKPGDEALKSTDLQQTKISEKKPSDDRNSRTLAGIVTFNPELDLLKKNIEALQGQVDEILIVDNGSSNQEDVLYLADSMNLSFISNYSNRGLAAALNQVLEYASDHDYAWYLTMDQDSIVSANLIAAFEPLKDEKTGIICPRLLNNNKTSLEEFEQSRNDPPVQISEPVDCITSASLTRTDLAQKIGGYEEGLFVDCIDVDFNIRMMENGASIVRTNDAYLLQQMGAGKTVPLFKKLFDLTGLNVFRMLSVTPVYSDFRIYYISRNSAWIRKKYGKKAGTRMQKAWMEAQFLYYCLTYPKKRSRKEMIRAWNCGKKDAESGLEEKSWP